MKRLLQLLFLGVMWMGHAQDLSQNLTVNFGNIPMKQALETLEKKSGYHFYYLNDWLKELQVSGDYQNQGITQILRDILKDTDLNFLVMTDGRIVLTKNSLIHTSLPDNYFGLGEDRDISEESPSGGVRDSNLPLALIASQQEGSNSITIIRIGKENRNRSATSYALTGKAIGALDGKPIPDLAIIVGESGKGVVTNANGEYSIHLPIGTNTLMTRGLGLQDTKTRVIIYNNGQYDFKLQESVQALDEVVIEQNRKKNVEEALTGITTLEIQKLKTIPLVLGERDILKAAISLPGVSTTGEGSSGYNVRGGKTDQNLILLDNGVIYNPTHFFGIFSAINPYSTGSATIYKGNIPVEYGGRLSSVFDITTKSGNTEKFSGEASLGPVTGNLVLETPIIKDKSSLLLGGRATYSDWILRSLDDEQLQKSQASFYDIIGKYHHMINENNTLDATGYYSSDTFSITSDSLYNYSNILASLKWNHKFSDKTTMGLSLSNSTYGFGITYDAQSSSDFDLDYQNNETALLAKIKTITNKNHTLSYGLGGKLYLIKPGRIDPKGSQSDVAPTLIPKEKGIEGALFLADSYKVNDKLLLDIGVRYSAFAALGPSNQRTYQEGEAKNSGTQTGTESYGNNAFIKTFGRPEARLSARYFLDTDLSIKASYNNTAQYIHTLSNNTTATPTDTWKLSDTNIDPQRASQYALGLYKNVGGTTYEISLEGYYKTQKNLLDYKVGAQLLMNETIETEIIQGDGKAYGIEFLLKKNEGRLNGWLGYTYSRSFAKFESEHPEEQVNNGAFFPSNYDKPHDLSVVANYKLTQRFSASANFVYQTGRPVTFPVGRYEFNGAEYVVYSDRNKFRIPDYYRLDVSFNVEGNHKLKKLVHSFWSFSVYNLLGRNNPYSVFFVTDEGNIKAYQSSIFSIPVPTITYNFKF